VRRNALHTLSDVKPAYLVIGTVLEILSVIAYAALTRSVLPAKGRPGFWTLLRIDTTTLGVSHIVPGGAATASAVRFRLLHVHGVAGPDAALGAAVQGVGSAIVLNVLLWIGLVVSIPVRGFNPLYTTAAIVGAFLVAGGVIAVIMLTRGQESSVRFVARRRPADPVRHRGHGGAATSGPPPPGCASWPRTAGCWSRPCSGPR
jgi:uncharacterized membrane protein YbhN (UPF0104 family)